MYPYFGRETQNDAGGFVYHLFVLPLRVQHYIVIS